MYQLRRHPRDASTLILRLVLLYVYRFPTSPTDHNPLNVGRLSKASRRPFSSLCSCCPSCVYLFQMLHVLARSLQSAPACSFRSVHQTCTCQATRLTGTCFQIRQVAWTLVSLLFLGLLIWQVVTTVEMFLKFPKTTSVEVSCRYPRNFQRTPFILSNRHLTIDIELNVTKIRFV